ncbi:hypothetical protein BpHYR1_047605 [Brachionus plicatilis]|uniref:Uncharacterized protein n=1 Tax=Brachionus plicatilis TaxID=10195 RepID=A0A3M7RT05_BRAPC|nr:hypothetical protein BpHYR1_047605 [Brachionus plicatilis]
MDRSSEPVVKELIVELMLSKLRLESTTLESLSVRPTPEKEVAAVKQGCMPSYLPMATVREQILLFNFNENIGTTIFFKY